MKKINLIEILGGDILDTFEKYRRERFRSFKLSDLSPSSPDFIEGVKSLAGSYAFKFFGMGLEESKKLLEKAQTIEEIEDIIKEELTDYEDGDDEYRETWGIIITEIKNPGILEGLIHLPENSFSDNDDVGSKIKELKNNGNFKEALELSESFNELKDLIDTKFLKEYRKILEKHSS
jgi:hypothetical protein